MKSKKSCAMVFGTLAGGTLCLILGFLGYRYIEISRRQAARPAIRIISPGLNETASLHKDIVVQVGATAQGNHVTILQFYADGFLAGEQRGPSDTLLGIWNWAPSMEGVHTLSFLAYNQEGDANLASIQVTAIPGADRDADGVPDEQDNCPDQAGPAASQGCILPDDQDQDGIPDAQDACPNDSGELADSGCPADAVPDRDRDGIPDVEDRCPDQAGLPEWDGCPAGVWVTDGDGDGLPDFMDTCPDEAGPVESGGCPAVHTLDTDGDGVLDDSDACIDQPGPPENNGCPISTDRDGDGIPDSEDACPDEAGLEESGGCLPDEGFTDTDGDGVIDSVDLCVSEPGPIENNGCPLPEDRDGDSVPDVDDNCPDVAGPASNEGCPYISLGDRFHIGELLIPSLSLDLCELMPRFCDRDGDGLRNEADDCPEEPGPPERNGCPVFPQDQDGDGVLDAYDECDTEAGEPANLGCPDPGDTDGDGLPLALDACPDQAGPPENHGCPRAGRRTNVEIEILTLTTDPMWIGTYCYLKVTGFSLMIRVPEAGMLTGSGTGSWNLPGDRRSTTITVNEDSSLTAEVMCWGQPVDPSILPQSLGTVIRTHGYEAWDNQLRHAHAVGSGGWFEIVYHLCRGSCP
jgi:hypothetical protein